MALQIRGDQLKDIADSSIKEGAAIQLDKLKLDDSATFSGALILSNTNTHSGVNTFSNETEADGTNAAVKLSGGMNIAKKLYVGSDLNVTGNLTVSGTTTTVNTEEIKLADNVIVINSNATGSASEDGGLEIERGDDDNKSFYWDESADKWSIDSENLSGGSFNATGAITGGSLTDGTATITGGAFSGSSVSVSGNIASSAGSVSGTSLSDGTASLSSGSMSGLVNVTASGQIQFGTLSDGTISGIKFIDEDAMGSDSDSHVPTQQSVKAYVDSKTSSGNLNLSAKVDNLSIELDDNSKLSVKDLGITNAMLAGSIDNDKLSNSSVTIGGQAIALGGSQDTFTGLASITSTVLTDGTASMTGGNLTGLSSVTSTAFVGDLTGDVTGQVTDITNHGISQLSDVDCANLEAYDFLMYDGSSFVNVIEKVVFHTVDEDNDGEVTAQAVVLSVASDDTFDEKSNVYLNGQKLRHGTSGQVGSGDREFYFDSSNSKIHFSSSLLSADDELEIRYLIDSDA